MAPDHGPGDARYQVYLLWMWRETAGSQWRAALRPASGGSRMVFADLEQLALFLLRLADERGGVSGAEPAGST